MTQHHFQVGRSVLLRPIANFFLNINYTLVRGFMYLQAGISGLLKQSCCGTFLHNNRGISVL